MRNLAILLIHLITTVAKLVGPGGIRAVIAESLLLKHQLIILNRGRERAPNLRPFAHSPIRPMDRVITGLSTLFIHPGRLARAAEGKLAIRASFYLFAQRPAKELEDFTAWSDANDAGTNSDPLKAHGFELSGGGEYVLWEGTAKLTSANC